MSDAKLRDLERRYRETGAVPDEAAWLAERVRVGTLEPQVLALCAHLGHAAAGPAPEPGLFGATWSFEEDDLALMTSGGPPSPPLPSWSAHLQYSFGEVGLRALTFVTRNLMSDLAWEWKERKGDSFPLTLSAALRGGLSELLRISSGGPPFRDRLRTTWTCQDVVEPGPNVPQLCAAIVFWTEGRPLSIDDFLQDLLRDAEGPWDQRVAALKEKLRDLLVPELLR